MHQIEVYLDLPILGALFGFIQDTTLLWMVAQISALKASFKRLLFGGFIGGAFQFFLLTNQASAGVLNPWILSPLVFLLIVPLMMNLITFFSRNYRNSIRALGYFYLLSLLLAGIHWGIDSINQRFFQWEILLFWRFILHLAFIFLIGEMGWGIVHRKIWEQICLFSIEIQWNNQHVKVNALLDTGNRLYDPLTKVPVIIVEMAQIKDLLPQEVISFTEDVTSQNSSTNFELPGYWMERIRILPFHSLGREHGILVGFRPDQLKVWQKQKETIIKNVIIAFYNRSLSPEGAFHALIPPTVLKEC